MKKVLLTGASGFIGSFLTEEALKRNYEVYAAVRKTSNKEYLTDPRIKFIELDFSDIEGMSASIAQSPCFDFVVHNAGLTKAIKRKDYFVSNYHYTKNLIDLLTLHKKISGKFIYMSSLAAYGPGNAVQLNPVKSSDTPQPLTTYGKSKLASEKYLQTLDNFPYIILRPTAVYGPREKDLYTVLKLINNNIEFLVGFKKQHLTFVYVKDLVNAVFLAMESEIINKGYFVSDGNVYDGKILGSVIKKQLGKKTIPLQLPVNVLKLIAMLSESTKYITRKQPVLNLEKVKEMESINWKCEVESLMNELNFKPKYDLKNGMRETIHWYKKANWLK